MTLELGVSIRALAALFDSQNIRPGMSREAPDGVMIRLGEMPMARRNSPQIQATAFVPILITLGSGAALNVFSNWLYDKLKGSSKGRQMITVNRKLVEVTTSDAMVRILEETIKDETP
jgi:hypothetical protein